MKTLTICICLLLTSCLSGPRFETTECSVDPIIELSGSLSQVEMALSIANIQYMLWTWSVRDGESADDPEMQKVLLDRINKLEQTEKIIAKELERRTK